MSDLTDRDLPSVLPMNALPCSATHQKLGPIIIYGVRVRCSENRNTMFLTEHAGQWYWVYDYETKLNELVAPTVAKLVRSTPPTN